MGPAIAWFTNTLLSRGLCILKSAFRYWMEEFRGFVVRIKVYVVRVKPMIVAGYSGLLVTGLGEGCVGLCRVTEG